MKYALIGEAFGSEEEAESKRLGRPAPFVGQAGLILNSCLARAGITREECLITNVFNFRPPNNKIKSIFVTKKNGLPGWPPLKAGAYLDPVLLPELERLYSELRKCKPKVIICLGGTALWALEGASALGPHRGHLHWWENYPMIPTYHPARILREYHLKHSLMNDLIKAKNFVDGDLKPAELDFISEPNMGQIKEFFIEARKFGKVSVDIETMPAYRAITCIGFGIPAKALCVPFFSDKKPGYSYWSNVDEEVEALKLCKDFIEDLSVKKIYHECNYDICWLFDILGIKTKGETFDTRVMHAGVLAELPHSLSDVTASFFLMPAWKALWRSSKDSDASADVEE